MAVVWTPIAESDLDDILYYIAVVDRRPEPAERIYFEIRHRLDEQDTKKLPGHLLSGAPIGWLYVKYKRWMIFYQPHAEGIEVLRVVDAVRDLPRQFRDEM
jgi:plasmid stabilization system protein ParE